MHDFIRAIGFSEIKSREAFRKIEEQVISDPTAGDTAFPDEETAVNIRYRSYGDGFGMLCVGDLVRDADMDPEYAIPCLYGRQISFCDYISVEKQSDKLSFSGICDDVGSGVSVIFQLLNMGEYLDYRRDHSYIEEPVEVTLSALSISGHVVLPILHDSDEPERRRNESGRRRQMIAQARQGDQEAIESLTMEDMDLYSTVSRLAQEENVLTLVESYLMPYGISCDQYAILGDILEVDRLSNSQTGEILYRMTINCNDLVMDLLIHEKDLLGEPEAGRRFRGIIWLQGLVNFGRNGV